MLIKLEDSTNEIPISITKDGYPIITQAYSFDASNLKNNEFGFAIVIAKSNGEVKKPFKRLNDFKGYVKISEGDYILQLNAVITLNKEAVFNMMIFKIIKIDKRKKIAIIKMEYEYNHSSYRWNKAPPIELRDAINKISFMSEQELRLKLLI
jgi:hypothetical protein